MFCTNSAAAIGIVIALYTFLIALLALSRVVASRPGAALIGGCAIIALLITRNALAVAAAAAHIR